LVVDIKEELLSALRGMPVTWDLREGSWSIETVFDDEPVEVIRVLNPFGPQQARLS
jgi:hypothetical protein